MRSVVCTGVCGIFDHRAAELHVIIFNSNSLHIRILHHVSNWTLWFHHTGVWPLKCWKKLSTLQKPLRWISYGAEQTTLHTKELQTSREHNIPYQTTCLVFPNPTMIQTVSAPGDTSPGLQGQKSQGNLYLTSKSFTHACTYAHAHVCLIAPTVSWLASLMMPWRHSLNPL